MTRDFEGLAKELVDNAMANSPICNIEWPKFTKSIIFLFSVKRKTDQDYEFGSSAISEVKKGGYFPMNLYRTSSLFSITAIAIWYF